MALAPNAVVATLVMGGCQVPQTSPDALIAAHRATIVETVREREAWEPSSYDIEALAEWDHGRLPILAVNTNRVMTAFAPLFAVLPGGALVSIYDEDSLARIVAAILPSPSKTDGPLVARLATMFGRFEQPVGEPVAEFPLGAPASPARAPTEIAYTRDGDAHRFEFYAFDHERMRLYDCRVVLRGDRVELFSQFLPPAESGQ